MVVQQETKAFFFTATIMRGNAAVIRQGTLNAVDAKAAIEAVYKMGRVAWKRSVLEVVILNPENGVVEATSKIGDSVQKRLLPYIVDDVEEEDNGFVPWNKPIDTFVPAQVGTYFTPKKFGKVVSFG